jgi:hypothetical protein
MAIKFKHGGREWTADTADEAIALRAKLDLWFEQSVILLENKKRR